MKMTYHCEIVRKNRVSNIIDKIGIGQVVKEKYCLNYNSANKKDKGIFKCITDTGITLIKNESKDTIITMYVTTYRELVAVYGGPRAIPTFLRKKVDRNQSFFTKEGKTIWK